MKEILRKSTQSISAANLLIEQGYYATSVHCSYYGVYQRMAYILQYVLGERNAKAWGDPEGSHNNTINRISQAALERDRKKARELHKYISNLKNNRVNADYYDTSIDLSFSKEAYKSAGMILATLNEIFEIKVNP